MGYVLSKIYDLEKFEMKKAYYAFFYFRARNKENLRARGP